MSEEVLSQALTPYFTTKAAGGGTGLGLVQVQRFAEGRSGAIAIESEQGAGTLVRLFLPRVCGAAVLSAAANADIAYTHHPTGTAAYSASSTQRRPCRHRSSSPSRRFQALPTSRPSRSPCSPPRFFRPLSGLLCSGGLRARSLSKRRRRAPACKYHNPPALCGIVNRRSFVDSAYRVRQ